MTIRKVITYARTLFLALFFVCLMAAIVTADGIDFTHTIVWGIISLVCFGISYALDWLLGDNNSNSPFMH